VGEGIVQLTSDPQPLLDRHPPRDFVPGPLRFLGALHYAAQVQSPDARRDDHDAS